LTLFGRVDPADGLPKSFHRYTMRQAIEEGFILDVLENYTPYQTAFNLQKQIADEKRVDKKYARRALGKWLSLHPTNVTQKVEFILEHFTQNVAPLLNGEAKAMVVTGSRAAAVKYKLAFDAAVKQNPTLNIRALVAFSGTVKGKDVGDGDGFSVDPDKDYSESNLNPDIGSLDLRKVFEQKEYRVMLVANKFQTGFNQPKLVAMYLDKKISGVEVVQTLSRLNRTYPGKDRTFVIDFVNDPKTVLSEFKKYDAGATLDEAQDLDVVYELKQQLDAQGVYNTHDLEAFKKARAKSVLKDSPDDSIHKALYAATQRPTDIFNAQLKSLNESINRWENEFNRAHKAGDELAKQQADHQRGEYTKEREALMLFKARLGRFVRVYSYIAQLVFFDDAELENFASFARLLAKRLQGVAPEQIDLSGLVLTGYDILPTQAPNEVKEDLVLTPVKLDDGAGNDREKEFLQDIIRRINELFGNIAPTTDQKHFTAQIVQKTQENNLVFEQITQNTKAQAMTGDLPSLVTQSVIQAMTSHDAIARALLKDQQIMKDFVGIVYDLVKAGKGNDMLGL
jgi:type I restriction enzyme R subunit